MNQKASADVVIFGGGIAGLWLLHRIRQAGLSALLFESNALGGGQTHKAQGIIHGGMKYALQGLLSRDAKALAEVPTVWKNCLQGKGTIDLTQVPVLSPKHYLWSPHSLTAKLTSWLASATLQSKVKPLAKEGYPTIFHHHEFKGEVFALDEMVIDVPILVRELVKANPDAVFKIEPLCEKELHFNEEGKCVSATIYHAGKALDLHAQQFVFTAGLGNEAIIKKLNHPTLAMQRRPLHMVLVNMPYDYPLYAHCLGWGPRPRVTITTHYTQRGQMIWYLGGQLAEEGVKRNSKEQIKATKAELHALFPWLELADAEFYTFMIDRAEPFQKSGLKPETAYTKIIANMIIAWPTKLAFAPFLAEDILQQLTAVGLSPRLFDMQALRAWPMPPLANPIWEDVFCKNVA